ncbi:AAA family ATPase [Psychrobacter sp. A3]|mgnify:CR=1 FL=1|uniref:AAA family ATPase n=1 Tax=Psychrobacter sp. A3 TaxID=2992754 RepID=UPI00237A96F9|nr:ATP-binding protein [Psychrobacter sp. A3]MDE0490950.1 AAA family ATPase [Psychrobacter sp. A3]
MHLNSLKIQNFRLLEDIEVKKLGHVNLIVGKNNSGKSTVLEAINLLASGFHPSSIRTLAHNRDDIKLIAVDDIRRESRIAFENFFFGRKYPDSDDSFLFIGNEDISVEIHHIFYRDSEITQEIEESLSKKVEYKIISKEDIDSIESINDIHSGLQIKTKGQKVKIIDLENDESLNFRSINNLEKTLPFSFVSSQLTNINDLAKAWDTLVFTENESYVVEALSIIEPDIQNLAFLSDEYSHKYTGTLGRRFNNDVRVPYIKLKNVEGRIPLHSMGDGVLRLLQIILKIFSASDGVLLIDEFENGLHYSVQKDVWNLIFEIAKRYNIQVFATTHSWDCIESFAQVAKEREDLDGILLRMGRSVRKSDKGKVLATEFDEDELYSLTKDKIEVR